MGVQGLVTGVGLALEVLFFVYFVRHMGFALSAFRSAPADLSAATIDTGYRPTVSVLVACKDEVAVVDHLVGALLALEYPEDRLQLVVVDDGSSDGTGPRLDEWAAARGNLHVVHRPDGAGGGKSGALNEGLDTATGEIIVIFDADHRPRPDVVRRLVSHLEDSRSGNLEGGVDRRRHPVGAVQGRCEIHNWRDTPLTHLVAIDYLSGYLVNEYGRQSLFQLPAYGGANCAVRAASLRAIGGWNTDSVTEDTDLTLRLVLRGERVRYDVNAVDEEEGVVSIRRYATQRYRWARGHQQVWRDYRGHVWASRHLSFAEKVETTLFLFAFHLPVLAALGTIVMGLWLAGAAAPGDPLSLYVLWTLLFLGPLLELGAGLVISNSPRRDALMLVLFLPMYFVSIAVCTKAWIDGVAGRRYSWAKTKRAAEPDSGLTLEQVVV
jgi:cellulose synthase/poly-beta-1,6-N-acetylglucosamine synthase-like glycosyltransferase